MKKVIYEGETGCGKTYQAINEAKKIGSFIYVAPCRQLVYESALKYSSIADSVMTGELKINGIDNIYAVYESLNHIDLDKYDSLLIDEAHYLTDNERNQVLLEVIENFKGNIFLMTATRNFETPENFEVKYLQSKQIFHKKEIESHEFWKRVEDGEPSIYFHKYSDNVGIYGGHPISANTLPEDRLQAQIAFSNGEISFIECTNVLAQGLNFPATNIYIEYNYHDSDETILQKIGRLGRPFLTDENAELTYCVDYLPDEIEKNKKIKKTGSRKSKYFMVFEDLLGGLGISNALKTLEKLQEHELPYYDSEKRRCYDFDKYSIQFLIELSKFVSIEALVKLEVISLSDYNLYKKITESRFKLRELFLKQRSK